MNNILNSGSSRAFHGPFPGQREREALLIGYVGAAQCTPYQRVGKGYETQLEYCSSDFIGWFYSFTARAGFNSPGKHPEGELSL